MKLKEGQRLKVKEFNKRPKHWEPHGKMDKWMGEIVTLKKHYYENIRIYEDCKDFKCNESSWRWEESDFQIVFDTWEDVNKMIREKCNKYTLCKNCPLYNECYCDNKHFEIKNHKQLVENFEKMFGMECYVLEEKEFTKSNLKNGMTVEYRNGKRRIKIDNKLVSLNTYHGELCEYYDNLICKLDRNFDIMKIYDDLSYYGNFEEMIDNPRNCIYERKEEPVTKDVSLEEINTLLKEKYPNVEKFNLPIDNDK